MSSYRHFQKSLDYYETVEDETEKIFLSYVICSDLIRSMSVSRLNEEHLKEITPLYDEIKEKSYEIMKITKNLPNFIEIGKDLPEKFYEQVKNLK